MAPTVSLRASEEGARECERARGVVAAQKMSQMGRHVDVHAINVVQLAMLEPALGAHNTLRVQQLGGCACEECGIG